MVPTQIRLVYHYPLSVSHVQQVDIVLQVNLARNVMLATYAFMELILQFPSTELGHMLALKDSIAVPESLNQ
jgi:hypothetical protein